MTPAELLSMATSRFNPLYYNDEDRLKELLAIALGTYQDKAGVVKSAKTSGTDIKLTVPDDFFELISCHDAYGRYHEIHNDGTDLNVVTDVDSYAPYTIWYLAQLRGYDEDTDLPGGVAGPVLEYLIALIDIENTKRARAVAQATGRQIDLSSDEELIARKLTIEMDIADSQAFLPMTNVY